MIPAPDAIVRQPNWSLLQSWLWAPPPPLSLFAQPAAASMNAPSRATKATHLGLLIATRSSSQCIPDGRLYVA